MVLTFDVKITEKVFCKFYLNPGVQLVVGLFVVLLVVNNSGIISGTTPVMDKDHRFLISTYLHMI